MKAIDVLNETYEIIEEIGSGGGGVVYHAIHKRLQTDVVIKRIKDEVLGKIQSRQEADVLKKLKHPYLPRVYDFIETDDGVYTIMDYIKGQNMESALKEHGKYTQDDVRKWALQLGEALDYLHRQNPPIIHSDIKPANIMLTPEGDVCLIDFNISLAMGNNEEVAVGISAGFSPPEQYRDPELYARVTHNYTLQKLTKESEKTELLSQKDTEKTELLGEEEADKTVLLRREEDAATPIVKQEPVKTKTYRKVNATYLPYIGKGITTRSDIYSLGMCLLTFLTGLDPEADFDNQLNAKNCGENISEGFATIIDRMISINPSDRYRDGAEYLAAIGNCHKLDHRYVVMHRQELVLRFVSIILFGLGISIGCFGIIRNRTDNATKFYSVIADIEKAIESGDSVYADELILQAKEEYHNAAVYKEELYLKYLSGSYTDCIEQGENIISTQPFYIETEYDKSQFGDICYLVGNSYYEQNDMIQAKKYFEQAIANDNGNPFYYRDYAISLARNGELDAAYDILSKAEEFGLETDSIELVKGEIASASKNYTEAVDCFAKVLSDSKDEQIIRRSLLLCADAYLATGGAGIKDAITLLENNLSTLNSGSQLVVKGKLADVYVVMAQNEVSTANQYYEKALNIYLDMRRVGYSSYQLMENMGIIYENMRDLENAESVFKEMLEMYPNRYEVYMLLAYLEADKQQEMDVTDREYQTMKSYYDEALKRYDLSIQDTRMSMLEKMMQDIVEGGWLVS